MKGKKKWLVIIPAIILMVGLIIPTGVSFILYQSVFGKRYQTSYARMNHTYDFDGLNRRSLSNGVSSRFPVFLTRDRWLYYFSDDTLMREQIVY